MMSCSCSSATRSALRSTCATTIDYASVPGDPILPFEFTIDPSSILYPAPGQNQQFIYTVTGHGEDTSDYADLSHFLLVICSDITEEMLQNVTVTIDGVPQNVIIGTNVEILPPDHPDNQTGCPGLKFDFGLNKVSGAMVVSFELSITHPIGPVTVCVYGGQTTQNNLPICGPVCGEVETTCPAVGYQRASVCVPVTITPFANVGDATTYCCGSPVITDGLSVCAGETRGTCTFTITQEICIAVPVVFGATAAVGDYTVQCLDVGDASTCMDCQNNP